MTLIQIIILLIFCATYVGIIFEHSFHINKAAWALASAGILWALVVLGLHYDPHVILHKVNGDIFEVVIFLMGAMSLVEILAHYRFFDVIKTKLAGFKISEKGFFIVIMITTFILSAIIDNMTATIIMIQVAKKFFWEENLLFTAAGIVIAANTGGAFSPIGDVTTIMLWLADKFSTSTIILQGFLPSFIFASISSFLLVCGIKNEGYTYRNELPTDKLTRGEKTIITIACLSFTLPLLAKLIGLTPILGILFGLGVTWLAIDCVKSVSKTKTHLTASIEHLLQKVDIASLKFFIGILLAVGALEAAGILERISNLLFSSTSSVWHIIISNTGLGILSAIFDNIPLTAIAIDVVPTTNPSLWVLLALTVGTGGSLFIIGSAAGVIAMGMVPKLTFTRYFKIAFIPALVGYVACVATWILFFFI